MYDKISRKTQNSYKFYHTVKKYSGTETAQKNAKQQFVWHTLNRYKYTMLKHETLQSEQIQNSDK